MTPTDKIGAAMVRSQCDLPAVALAMVKSMLKPDMLAVNTRNLVVWAGSQALGVGKFIDIVLLGVGVVALGPAIVEGAGELYAFTTSAMRAQTDSDLEEAANHFARAVTLLGVSTVQAVLMRGHGRVIALRRLPRIGPRRFI